MKRCGPLESLGPGPFAAMLLADMGANVLRIAKSADGGLGQRNGVLGRGRTATLVMDLKHGPDIDCLLRLVGQADILIEGFRPGVIERLGCGPEVCFTHNPRLVYGRITGWGRAGPLAQTAGHDINYIALTGALHACGTAASGPVPPLNLVGDFGGGGMLLAFGLVCALSEARDSKRGQVVDAAMIDGSSLLMSMMYGMRAAGQWPAPRAGNLLDGSAYFYTCYECSDGGWVAVGAIEPQFRTELLRLLGLGDRCASIMAMPHDDADVRQELQSIFKSRPRTEWQRVFEGSNACVTPVLDMDEAHAHPQHRAQETFSIIDGVIHPNPAPRFSRSRTAKPDQYQDGEVDADLLREWGLTPNGIL